MSYELTDLNVDRLRWLWSTYSIRLVRLEARVQHRSRGLA